MRSTRRHCWPSAARCRSAAGAVATCTARWFPGRPVRARTRASSGCTRRSPHASASRASGASSSSAWPLRTTCTASGDGAVRCPRTSGCSCSPRCAVGPPTRRTTRPCTSPASSGCFTRRRVRSARCGARAIRVGACTGTASPSSSARRSRWMRRLSRRSPSGLRRRRGTWGWRRSWSGSGSATACGARRPSPSSWS